MVGEKEIPKGYKQTEVGVVPVEWGVKFFKNISSMNGRIGWQGLKQYEFTSLVDDPFLITGMDSKGNNIEWSNIYHIPETRYNEAVPIQLKQNDILMTKDGTIGKILYVEGIPYPYKASLNSHLLVFRPIAGLYNPRFLYYVLNSKFFFDHIEKEKSGSTFFGLSQEAAGKFKVPLPPPPRTEGHRRSPKRHGRRD